MKAHSLFLIAFLSLSSVKASNWNVTISGTTYSPASITVDLNDVVTIEASAAHPLVQVSKATWNQSLADTMAGGWGVKTANHTFSVLSQDTIYFVCQNHASIGMKGMIIVSPATNKIKSPLAISGIAFENPAKSGELVLINRGNEPVTADFYDMQGKRLYSIALVEGNNRISFIENGLYLLLIKGSNNVEIRKEKLLVQ